MPFLYSDIAYLMYVTVNLKLDKYIIEKYQKKTCISCFRNKGKLIRLSFKID